MSDRSSSSSLVQQQAEADLFQRVSIRLGVALEQNRRIPVTPDGRTCVRPDFYSGTHRIVGEIFAHIGKPKKAQDNKIANDVLKMLLLDQATGITHRKLLVVCNTAEHAKLTGRSALAESIRRFGVEVLLIDPGDELREMLLQAQARQRMTNAE